MQNSLTKIPDVALGNFACTCKIPRQKSPMECRGISHARAKLPNEIPNVFGGQLSTSPLKIHRTDLKTLTLNI